MSTAIEGRVWLFGDNIDTDQMAPGHAMPYEWEKRVGHLFPTQREFVEGVQPGDIVIAGRNWGCGSSREQAVENLMLLGVSCVIAESFARIFLRNAIANALPAITCEGIASFCDQGDRARFEWDTFTVSNLTKNQCLPARRYTPEMIDIIQQGGMVKMLQRRFAAG